MIDAFLGKFSKEQRKDLSEVHGVLWEEDDAVPRCRDCMATFSLALRKHHCRGCGGIFCEDCTHPNTTLHAGSDPIRACFGCQRGETPGELIVRAAERLVEKKSVEGRVTFPPSQMVTLFTGSLYGDDDSRSVRLDGSNSHRQGYFEIVNKSNEMMAVKLLQAGGDPFRELCRPSYLAVPPMDSIHGIFDCGELEIIILYSNPNRLPKAGSRIVCDTRLPGATAADISPCAAIKHFTQAAIYRVADCRGHNVLLKYKGGDELQIRLGNSVGRLGGSLLARMGSSELKLSNLDFKTNVESINFVFSTTSSDV